MTRGQKRLRATLTLIGTIIGAGVFGVPAMIGAWGVPVATVGFIILTGVVLATHLLLAEAVAFVPGEVRVAGLATRLLGDGAGAVTGLLQTLQVFGSNLAYLILGGEFLGVIAMAAGIDIPVIWWQALFWLVAAVAVTSGLAWMAKVESFLTWMLLAVMILIIGIFVGRMDLLLLVKPSMMHGTFEPYGVFLFSLFGMNIIPEMEEMVSGRKDDLRTSIIRATLISAVLTYVFGVTAWLASGGTLSRSVTDIVMLLPPGVRLAVPVFGFLAVLTSYVTTTYDLGRLFRVDYRLQPWMAWTAVLGVPFMLLFLTSRDFLATIGLAGSLFTGGLAVCCVLMGRAALTKASHTPLVSKGTWWHEVVPALTTAILVIGGVTWLVSP
jgi:amino acid permease